MDLRISPLVFGSELLLLLCAGFGFIYGVYKFFKPKKALFIQIVVCAMGCLALGELFTVVTISIRGSMAESFHVGMLGSWGCFLFLFSASFGQMDGLVDGGEKQYQVYRRLALIPALLILFSYTLVFISPCGPSLKIVYGLYFAILMLLSYYNTKHILFPDVDFGILKSIRSYNGTVLVFSMLNIILVISRVWNQTTLESIVTVLIAAVSAVIVPVLERGAQKWFQ